MIYVVCEINLILSLFSIFLATKCDFELTKDGMANGWISSLDRSYCLSGYRG